MLPCCRVTLTFHAELLRIVSSTVPRASVVILPSSVAIRYFFPGDGAYTEELSGMTISTGELAVDYQGTLVLGLLSLISLHLHSPSPFHAHEVFLFLGFSRLTSCTELRQSCVIV